jgi:3-hydroxyacyl-[acyl-carrier-protein] dehydratase
VASEPLFDLSALDLGATAVSAERVGELNPQCGHMRQLDRVIWLSEDNTLGLGVKHVREDEFWVPCHIPGRPLLPGVLLIEAAAQLSSIMYRLKSGEPRFLGFTRCNEVAFRGQTEPGDTLYLLAREKEYRRRRFETFTQGIVGGKLVFEGLLTGMVM